MATFLLGLVILVAGAAVYGKFCEKVFGPDDRETPAYTKQDGVDYVPMKSWKNMLINLLNIAGTGPIFGALGGALFGPVAYLWIIFGNIHHHPPRQHHRRRNARLLLRYDLPARRRHPDA